MATGGSGWPRNGRSWCCHQVGSLDSCENGGSVKSKRKQQGEEAAEKEEESPPGPLESQLKSSLAKAHTLCGSANMWGSFLPSLSPPLAEPSCSVQQKDQE